MTTRRIIVPTEAIDLSAFLANPVMLYNHTPGQVYGRWENVQIAEGKLVGDAVFDDADPDAAKLKGKVERGFIKAASIGIRNVEAIEFQDEHGEKYLRVTRCELREASIVDVPANGEALKFYDDANRELQFNDWAEAAKNFLPKPIMHKQLIAALGLADDATEPQAVAEITRLKQAATELENLRQATAAAQKAKAIELADAAIADGRMAKEAKEHYLKLADADFSAFEGVIKSMPRPQRLSEFVKPTPATPGQLTNDPRTWNFSDWQKFNPKGLALMQAQNPQQFAQLYELEFGQAPDA